MQVNRRQFFKICAGGVAGSSLAAMGVAPATAFADVRAYKIARDRNPQHLSVLFRWLWHSDVQPR